VRWKCASSQPATEAKRSDHEDGDLVAEGADAHGLGHLRAALERADGSARARVQQIDQRHRTGNQNGPAKDKEQTALANVHLKGREALEAQQAVVLAQGVEVAHEVVE